MTATVPRCLTRATAFEAVMRVRATRGIRITNFYGNYFIRGTDLLALPNCTADRCGGALHRFVAGIEALDSRAAVQPHLASTPSLLVLGRCLTTLP